MPLPENGMREIPRLAEMEAARAGRDLCRARMRARQTESLAIAFKVVPLDYLFFKGHEAVALIDGARLPHAWVLRLHVQERLIPPS